MIQKKMETKMRLWIVKKSELALELQYNSCLMNGRLLIAG